MLTLSIINNPGRHIEDTAYENGVTIDTVRGCYRMLGMDLDNVPSDCVGAPKYRKVHFDSVSTVTARMRRYAFKNGLTFKSVGGGYALCRRRTTERVSGVHTIDWWRNFGA